MLSMDVVQQTVFKADEGLMNNRIRRQFIPPKSVYESLSYIIFAAVP